jgi:hypothetical protein
MADALNCDQRNEEKMEAKAGHGPMVTNPQFKIDQAGAIIDVREAL